LIWVNGIDSSFLTVGQINSDHITKGREQNDKTRCQQMPACSNYTAAGNFCANISETELCDLGNHSKSTAMKRSEEISAEILETWPIISVSAGVISMQHLLEDGRKTIATFFMQGDIIDVRGISKRHRGQLIALGKTKICRLSPEVFEEISDGNPNAQRVIWDNLREQTYRAMDHSADLAKKHALEKLASFVFECRWRQIVSIADNLVTIPVRRVDLAEYLGMQPETVSRCFKDLEKRRIIKFNTISNLKILNIPTLRRIANGDQHADETQLEDSRKFKVLTFG